MPFSDIDSLREHTVPSRTSYLANYIERRRFSKRRTVRMQNVLGLTPIEYPHAFYLDSPPYLDRSPWEIDRILEIIKDREGRNDASKYPCSAC